MPKIVSQVAKNGELKTDCEEKFNTRGLLKEIFIRNKIEVVGELREGIKVKISNKKYLFLVKQVTYLGNPHAEYKKRIQIPIKWIEIYNENKDEFDVKFIGIYKYGDNIILVDFDKTQYIERRVNNSSAHVSINDIYKSTTEGIFQKKDKNNNIITCVRENSFLNYIEGKEMYNDEVIEIIKKFNSSFPFQKEIKGILAYDEMVRNDFAHKYQAEWPGFYLEFKFSEFLENNKEMKEIIEMKSNKAKKKNLGENLDFDLWSNKFKFYSDLKASNISKNELPLNDKINVLDAVDTYSKIWYIIYEHSTELDENFDFVTRKHWKEIQGKKSNSTYKMKNSVKFQKMIIIEINSSNKHLLADFPQGHNSNGKERKVKFKLNKKLLQNDNFVIYREQEKNENF